MKNLIPSRLSGLFLILICFSFLSPVFAEVKLPGVLSSNMVLQRNAEIKIWGWATNGEMVKVTFNNLTRSARTTKEGKWSVAFPAMKEGGPYELAIQGRKNKITLNNILIGDVWICSGQSNMEWSVARSDNPDEEIKNATHPNIRLLTIPKNALLNPAEDVITTGWVPCTPETIPNFSAVGYFFGRKVNSETGVPIGLINTSWGGTNVEAWTSFDYMQAFPEYGEKLAFLNTDSYEKIKNAENLRYEMMQRDFNIRKGEVPAENWADPSANLTYWKTMRLPTAWEARGLSGVDGVVWFRKEVELTPEQATDILTLNLGKIDDSDITWVNGTEVGKTTDQNNKLRSYAINPGIFKSGKNIIVVKVTDNGANGGLLGATDDMNLTAQNWKIPLAGDWRYRLSGENLLYTHAPMAPNEIPSQLFNGMIYPLRNLKVKGAIWYQGESNAGRAYLYRDLFPNMINCWREYWKQPDMPFLFVQLANFKPANDKPVESEWAELREAQCMALSLPKTGMAVAIDIGDANDIHPTNKQDVGLRLGLNALKIAYEKDLVSMGPLYKSMEVYGNKAILEFEHTGSGLTVKDKYGYLRGFSIAGPDKKFFWAKATIDDNKVIVYSPEVPSPVAVRYGWADNPDDVNLYNNEGLPASPFRTDDWDGLTKK